MGEIIFGTVAAICLCVFVGVGCWVLVQDWKAEQRAESRKREAESCSQNDESQKVWDYIYHLEDLNYIYKTKLQNELLRRKLKELGIRHIIPPEEQETTQENESSHS